MKRKLKGVLVLSLLTFAIMRASSVFGDSLPHKTWTLQPANNINDAHTMADGGRYKYILDLGTIEKVENGIIYTGTSEDGWLYKDIEWITSDIPSGGVLVSHNSGYGFIDYYTWQTPPLGTKREYSITVKGKRIRRGPGSGGGTVIWQDWDSTASGEFQAPIIELIYPTDAMILEKEHYVQASAKALVEGEDRKTVVLVWTFTAGSGNSGSGAGFGEGRASSVTQAAGGDSGWSSVNFYVSDKELDTFKINVQCQNDDKKETSGIIIVQFLIEADLKDEPPEGSEYASGVDDTQVWARLNDVTISPILTSIEDGYHLAYTPSISGLNTSGTNTVKVSVKDEAGNQNDPNPKTWSFSISCP